MAASGPTRPPASQRPSRAGQRESKQVEQHLSDPSAAPSELAKQLHGGAIDPVVAKLGELDAQERKLSCSARRGSSVTSDFRARRQNRGQPSSLSRYSDTSGKAALSQGSAAATWQCPRTVHRYRYVDRLGPASALQCLQQGGQLKDMFGGIGPPVKAVGGYVLGLLNPINLRSHRYTRLAATLSRATRTVAFNKALISTGNTRALRPRSCNSGPTSATSVGIKTGGCGSPRRGRRIPAKVHGRKQDRSCRQSRRGRGATHRSVHRRDDPASLPSERTSP